MKNNNKILVISTAPTHPTISGNRSAILSYSELLKEMGYEVSFLFVQTCDTNKRDKEKTQKYWGHNFFYYKTNKLFYRKRLFFRRRFVDNYDVDNWYPNGLARFVKKMQNENNFNIIILNYIWLTKVFNYLSGVKKILFTHDVFSDRFKRTGIRWFSVSPAEEAKALDRCDLVLAIQDLESKYFGSITNTKIITSYSPVQYKSTQICNNKTILFLAGPNDYNTEGLVHFINNIWPKIKKEFPDLKLLIGGGICKRPEIQNKGEDIELLGKINDLQNFYSKGDIFINYVFEGAGLKIKNIEVLSYGKIVVCHSHNIEGIFQ